MGRRIKKVETNSAEETNALAKALAKDFQPGDILCLLGDLGAGKTTFMKGLVSALSAYQPEEVVSPTFTYLNIYEGAPTIYHFDLYRLGSVDEFLSLGFEEYLFGSGLCCLEWSERIAPLLPQNIHQITLSHMGENRRKICYEVPMRQIH